MPSVAQLVQRCGHPAQPRCLNVESVIVAMVHTAVALRDPMPAKNIPVIEGHPSNVHGWETFRHRGLTAGECDGFIAGLGPLGHRLTQGGVLDAG